MRLPEDLLATGIPGAVQRVAAWLKAGVDVVSHYTGQASPEQAAHFIQTAFQYRSLVDLSLDEGFKFREACDIKPMCRKLLCSFPPTLIADHVFGDIVERLPPDVLRTVRALTPTKEDYELRTDCVTAAHAAIEAGEGGSGDMGPSRRGLAFRCLC